MMGVSSLIHETAHWAIQYMQLVEPETFDRLVARLGGINAYNMMHDEGYIPKGLPEAFSTWTGYRDYLLEKLTPEKYRAGFLHRWEKQEGESWAREHVAEILTNDWEGVKNANTRNTLRHKAKRGQGRYG